MRSAKQFSFVLAYLVPAAVVDDAVRHHLGASPRRTELEDGLAVLDLERKVVAGVEVAGVEQQTGLGEGAHPKHDGEPDRFVIKSLTRATARREKSSRHDLERLALLVLYLFSILHLCLCRSKTC